MPHRSAVGEARLALPNFYNITIRIANVAARLCVLVLRLRDKHGSSTSTLRIASLSATRIFIKLPTESESAGTLSVTVGLSGVRPPPTLTMMQVVWKRRLACARGSTITVWTNQRPLPSRCRSPDLLTFQI